MTSPSTADRDGVVRANPALMVFLAEALAVPTGLVTIVYLSRQLGTEPYGVYALAAVVTGWAQMTLASMLGRAAQGFVSDAADWRPAAADIVLLHALVGGLAAAATFVLAPPLALALHAPALGPNLQLFAVDVLLFTTGQGLRSVAMGVHRFQLRAVMAAVRWISRLALVFLFVGAGLGVSGAILAGLGASVLELAVGLVALRLPPPSISLARLPGFWRMAAPLSASGVGLRLFEKADILMVQALSGAKATGLYGAAQNVTIIAGIFGMSYAGVLMTTVSRCRASPALVSAAADDALRVCLRLAPPAALGAALSPDLARLAFGPQFVGAGAIMGVLALAALGLIWISVATAVLAGAGHGRLVLAVTGWVLPVAILGHLLLVPGFGGLGAATCTALVAAAAAVAAWGGVRRRIGLSAPWPSILRNFALGALVLAAATWPPIADLPFFPRALGLAFGLALALLATGEVTRADIVRWLGRRR